MLMYSNTDIIKQQLDNIKIDLDDLQDALNRLFAVLMYTESKSTLGIQWQYRMISAERQVLSDLIIRAKNMLKLHHVSYYTIYRKHIYTELRNLIHMWEQVKTLSATKEVAICE